MINDTLRFGKGPVFNAVVVEMTNSPGTEQRGSLTYKRSMDHEASPIQHKTTPQRSAMVDA
jgi:hypothetical protein